MKHNKFILTVSVLLGLIIFFTIPLTENNNEEINSGFFEKDDTTIDWPFIQTFVEDRMVMAQGSDGNWYAHIADSVTYDGSPKGGGK